MGGTRGRGCNGCAGDTRFVSIIYQSHHAVTPMQGSSAVAGGTMTEIRGLDNRSGELIARIGEVNSLPTCRSAGYADQQLTHRTRKDRQQPLRQQMRHLRNHVGLLVRKRCDIRGMIGDERAGIATCATFNRIATVRANPLTRYEESKKGKSPISPPPPFSGTWRQNFLWTNSETALDVARRCHMAEW